MKIITLTDEDNEAAPELVLGGCEGHGHGAGAVGV